MLRVAVITRHFPSSGEPWQGRSSYQTLRALARRAKVHVFYPNSAYPRYFRPRTRLYDSLDHSYQPLGVEASYHDYSALPLLSRPLNGWMGARELLPHVRRFNPDVVLGIFLYPAGYTALKIGRELSVPVVVKAVGSDLHSIADRVSAALTRRVVNDADFIVTASEDLRQRAIALGAAPDKCQSTVNGCDVSVFHPANREDARRRLDLDPEPRLLVYIGRIDLRKGLLELVNATARLRKAHPNLRLYMVGEGPDRPQVEEAIAKNEAADYIQLMPACKPDDVAVWMTASDIVTLPSYMEGCPNAVLEALACGRPVVATNVGGIPEIMSDACGRLVRPRDVDALVEGLDSALTSKWDANSISSQWTRGWDTVAAELLDIFNSLVKKQHAGNTR